MPVRRPSTGWLGAAYDSLLLRGPAALADVTSDIGKAHGVPYLSESNGHAALRALADLRLAAEISPATWVLTPLGVDLAMEE